MICLLQVGFITNKIIESKIVHTFTLVVVGVDTLKLVWHLSRLYIGVYAPIYLVRAYEFLALRM